MLILLNPLIFLVIFFILLLSFVFSHCYSISTYDNFKINISNKNYFFVSGWKHRLKVNQEVKGYN